MAVLVFYGSKVGPRKAVVAILATPSINQTYCNALYLQNALVVTCSSATYTSACKLSLLFLRTAFLQQIVNDERTYDIACVRSTTVVVHFFLPYFETSQECSTFESESKTRLAKL